MTRLGSVVLFVSLLSACDAPKPAEVAQSGAGSVDIKLGGREAKGGTLTLADPACTEGSCVCKGSVDEKVLGELARTKEQVEKGLACLAADFDANGAADFAVPIGEGNTVVLMNGAAGLERSLTLAVGGDLALSKDPVGLRASVDGVERNWTWAKDGFQYSEKSATP